MLKIDLDLSDVERVVEKAGYEVVLTVDDESRLEVEARGLKVLGFGNVTARARVGPLNCDPETGACETTAEIVAVAGLKLGKKFVAKKLLGLLKRRHIPEMSIDADEGRVVIDTDRLIARFAPLLAGYRVAEATFVATARGAKLRLEIAEKRS